MLRTTTLVTCLALVACTADKPAPEKGSGAPSKKEAPAKKADPAKKPAKLDVGHVDAAGAAKLLAAEPEVVVLDVRTPGEFAAGHIDKAINIDFKADDFATKIGKLDKSKKYLVHCASGGRSTMCLPTLEKQGLTKVVHLDGGFRGWQKAGNPVKK